jgi:hypothetical protein
MVVTPRKRRTHVGRAQVRWGLNTREVSYIVHYKSVTNTLRSRPCCRFELGFRCNQGIPMRERRNLGRHTFVRSFRASLGQPTTSLLEFAIGQWTFVAYVQPQPQFLHGRPLVWVCSTACSISWWSTFIPPSEVGPCRTSVAVVVRLIPILDRNVGSYQACS